MTKKIVVQLGNRKHKRNRSEAARKRDRERLLTDARFKANREVGQGALNKTGVNQHTSPNGHKLISEAMKVYINDRAPDELCREVHLPSGSTFADVIAKRQMVIAAAGSLNSVQFAQDATEGKMSGPSGGSTPAVLNKIEFVTPK